MDKAFFKTVSSVIFNYLIRNNKMDSQNNVALNLSLFFSIILIHIGWLKVTGEADFQQVHYSQ